MNRMVNRSGEEGAGEPGDARLVALMEELGVQLRRMGAAGPKIMQLLSMIQLERASGEAPGLRLGALVDAREPLPLRRVQQVVERDLDARLQAYFPASTSSRARSRPSVRSIARAYATARMSR